MLIETYIRERDAQNPYDNYYSMREEEVNSDTRQEARQRDRQPGTNVRVYYADRPSADVPEYNPADVKMAEDNDRQRGSDRVVSIESFYDDGADDAEDNRPQSGAAGATNTATVIDSYYVN